MERYGVRVISEQELQKAQQGFLSKVYAWMVGGLLLTGLTAWYVFTSSAFIYIVSNSILFFGLIIGELILVSVIASRINQMSRNVAGGLFLLYSILNGVTFSVIFAAFTADSIQNVFFISAAMFAGLSAFGFFTKRNLSGIGNFMMMGLIGIIFASILNIFLGSSALYFAVSFLGVIIFAGLTAWDTQKLKALYLELDSDEAAAKGAIFGALMLYLDFVNLFLFLLRLFGNRK